MELSRGLVIGSDWIDLILSGEKTWEMRSQNTKIRGWIGLIRKGSGTVVGVAKLHEVGPAQSLQEMHITQQKHQIPTEMLTNGQFAKYRVPWKLSQVSLLQRPVQYIHTNGAVIWVKLDEGAISEIHHQVGS